MSSGRRAPVGPASNAIDGDDLGCVPSDAGLVDTRATFVRDDDGGGDIDELEVDLDDRKQRIFLNRTN